MNNQLLVLKGGIGNQLFIIALGVLLRSKGFTVRFDVVSGFYRDFRYSRTLATDQLLEKRDIVAGGKKWRTLLGYYRARFLKFGPRYIRSDVLLPIDELLKRLGVQSNYIEGYWFDSSFVLTESADDMFNLVKQGFELREIAEESSVAVHLRIYEEDMCLKEVMDFLACHDVVFRSAEVRSRQVKIFSNSRNGAHILKSILEKKMAIQSSIIQGADPVDDIRLACRAKLFIGSASTFSWWIAFLIKYAGGRVLLPTQPVDHELYEWKPDLLLPEGW